MSANDPPPPETVPSDPTGCAVEAYGVVRVPFGEIAALRKAPGPSVGGKVPASLMKHADHQTVLALAAVLRAAHDSGWQGRSFAGWGVIAAPRFLGRVVAAGSMDRFQRQGVPGMSPLIIPTLSLHAVAGSLSLAIKAHGFNYGVGGGPNHLAEALLTGLAVGDELGAAGVWVVATGFDPEPVPDTAGNSLVPSVGYGVALALSASAAGRARLGLRVVPASAVGAEPAEPGAPTPLVALADFLSEPRARRWYCPLPGGVGAIEFDHERPQPQMTQMNADHSRIQKVS